MLEKLSWNALPSLLLTLFSRLKLIWWWWCNTIIQHLADSQQLPSDGKNGGKLWKKKSWTMKKNDDESFISYNDQIRLPLLLEWSMSMMRWGINHLSFVDERCLNSQTVVVYLNAENSLTKHENFTVIFLYVYPQNHNLQKYKKILLHTKKIYYKKVLYWIKRTKNYFCLFTE